MSTHGRTYVGLPESGLFTIDTSNKQQFPFAGGLNSNLEPQEPFASYARPFPRNTVMNAKSFRPKVCGSLNTNQKLLDQVISSVQPDKVARVAGAGNKFVHLTEGHSDFYLNLVPGLKHWDMCGSEAILAARFGIVTDANMSPL